MESPFVRYLGIFFLVAAAQGLFFSATQLSLGRRLNAPRLFLALVIVFFSLALIESGLWWSEKIAGFVHFISIAEPLPFLFGPLVYFYFKSSFSAGPAKNDWLHLLPFTLCFLYYSQFYFNSAEAKTAMMNGEIPLRDFYTVQFKSVYRVVLMSVSHVAYCFFIWREFYRNAAGMKEIRTWFLLSSGVFAFYTLNYAVFHILSYYQWIGGCSDYGIGVSMSIFIYLFSWFGFVRPRVFDGYAVKEALRPALAIKSKAPGFPGADGNNLHASLQELMRTEKLYKDEAIRLDTLALRLGVSRNNLSQAINATGMNFFEYINSWRIEEAKKILSETTKKELNVIEVAYEVGFNNKVSFNKFFKKTTGLTPTEFRRAASGKEYL